MTFLYGGDEVGALVLDVGSAATRAGWAGEDGPRAVFPSAVGRPPRDADGDAQMADGPDDADAQKPRKRRANIAVGDTEVNCWRAGMEVRSPLKDGLVDDWDTLEALWDHVFYQSLDVNPAEHPLLVTETAWNTTELRERLTELAFEKYNVPAFFVAKDAVLAAFAAGRSNGLVLSCGASMTSAVPVYEGYALKKGVVKQALAGDAVSEQALELLKSRYELDVVPQYMIKSKEVSTAGMPAKFTTRDRPGTTDSFHRLQVMRAVNDWKETVCQVAETSYDENAVANRPPRLYEFPSGYNNQFGKERYEAPEVLFNPKRFLAGTDCMPIQQLVASSIAACDVDLRSTLWGNVILTGGSTSVQGFAERLNRELFQYAPAVRGVAPTFGLSFSGLRAHFCSPQQPKVRLHLPSNSAERRFGSWIGGSILASLGTFQQLWISKQEFQEAGASIVEKRCS
ncbi:actin family [Hyaloraphidium curvatum]|nr:actin family [Hyaloraphidium curvatum]